MVLEAVIHRDFTIPSSTRLQAKLKDGCPAYPQVLHKNEICSFGRNLGDFGNSGRCLPRLRASQEGMSEYFDQSPVMLLPGEAGMGK